MVGEDSSLSPIQERIDRRDRVHKEEDNAEDEGKTEDGEERDPPSAACREPTR